MFRRSAAADFDLADSPPASTLSLGAILTGVLIAVMATWLLAAGVVAALTSLGFDPIQAFAGDHVEEGIASGVAFVGLIFLGSMWGGYTAGRMARDRGGLHGALVAVLSLVAFGLAASAIALGSVPGLVIPAEISELSRSDYFVNWRFAIEIAGLVVLIAGAILGGILGARWHRRFEVRIDDRIDRSFAPTSVIDLGETVPNPK